MKLAVYSAITVSENLFRQMLPPAKEAEKSNPGSLYKSFVFLHFSLTVV